MRTGLFLAAGLLLMAGSFILARLFAENFAAATTVATGAFLLLWFALTLFNLWVGVSKAGYAVAEELPVLLVLFGVPAAIAVLLKWKWL